MIFPTEIPASKILPCFAIPQSGEVQPPCTRKFVPTSPLTFTTSSRLRSHASILKRFSHVQKRFLWVLPLNGVSHCDRWGGKGPGWKLVLHLHQRPVSQDYDNESVLKKFMSWLDTTRRKSVVRPRTRGRFARFASVRNSGFAGTRTKLISSAGFPRIFARMTETLLVPVRWRIKNHKCKCSKYMFKSNKIN